MEQRTDLALPLPDLLSTVVAAGAALLLALALPITAAGSAATPRALQASSALALFLSRSPTLRREKIRLAGHGRAARSAGPWPNPTLSYTREQLFSPEGRDLLGVGLTIPLGNAPGRERARARQRTRLAAARLAVLRHRRGLAFLRSFYRLRYLQELASSRSAALKRRAGLEKLVAARIAGGRAGSADRLLLELSTRRLTAELGGLRSRIGLLGGRLAAELGLKSPRIIAASPLLPRAVTGVVTGSRGGVRKRFLRSVGRVAKARVDLARARGWPGLGVALGYLRQEQPGGAPAAHGLAVGLSIPLPLFSRNRATIARALAARLAARVSLTAWARLRPRLLRQTRAALADARRRLERYRRDALPRLPRVRRAAEAAFLAGSSVLSLLEAQDLIDRHSEVELALRRRVRKLFLDLHEVSGRLPNS